MNERNLLASLNDIIRGRTIAYAYSLEVVNGRVLAHELKEEKNQDRYREFLTAALNKAYALKSHVIDMLPIMFKHLENYPQLLAIVRQYFEEAIWQKDALEQLLTSMGEAASTSKEMSTELAGNLLSTAHALASDEILKNLFMLNALTRFQEATYRSLVAIGEECGEQNVVQVCRRILMYEEATAKRLGALIEPVTLAYLQREVSSEVALGRLLGLTPTEARVALAVVEGLSTPEVAEGLKLHPATVRTHLYSVFAKTGVHRQSELARLLFRLLPALRRDKG
jgi:DNA-binding CsgD family transcriptional regulator/ferritin-like metal-binding protein YciE